MMVCCYTGLLAQWPYFQQDHSSVTTGITYEDPYDMHFDGSNKVYSYHSTAGDGIIVAKYNAASGALIDVVYLSRSGYSYTPVRIRTAGTDYYALFNFVSSGMNRYGLIRLNSTTNALSFVRQINNTGNTLDLAAVDFILDGGGTNVYVLSNAYDAMNNQTDLCVTKMDVSTSTPVILWNNIYRNLTRDEFGSNIILQNGQLFASSISVSTTSMLDRGPLLLKLDVNGGFIDARIYKYTSTCTSARSAGTWVVGANNNLGLSSISYVGADGNGPLWLAKIDPVTLAINQQSHYSSGAAYLNPEIQPVASTSGSRILMSGSAPFYNTANPGYVHYYFDPATLAFTQGVTYPTTNPSHWSGVIYDSYINTGNGMNVFSVMQNYGTANNYHLLKTSDLGDNACDQPVTITPTSCKIEPFELAYTAVDYPATLAGIKPFSIQSVNNTFSEICLVTCPDCPVSPPDDPIDAFAKSLTIDNTAADVIAFPNPTNGLLTLEPEEGLISDVKIITLTGNKTDVGIRQTVNGYEIDLSSAKNGIYLVEFLLNGERRQLRIVKQ